VISRISKSPSRKEFPRFRARKSTPPSRSFREYNLGVEAKLSRFVMGAPIGERWLGFPRP